MPEPLDAAAIAQAIDDAINEYGVYIGLDVHKDSITIGVVLQGRSSTSIPT